MSTAKKKNDDSFLQYKGKPLVRSGNTVYYGDPSEEFIIMLQILETENIKDLEVATKVSVQLQTTDPDVNPKDIVVKKTEKDGLYNALDIAMVWLDRALKKK